MIGLKDCHKLKVTAPGGIFRDAHASVIELDGKPLRRVKRLELFFDATEVVTATITLYVDADVETRAVIEQLPDANLRG